MWPLLKAMLARLDELVPNIDPARQVLGGFSNGAHTTALLVSAVDPFILKHFSGFFLLDGGLHIASFHKTAVREKRFIYFVGGRRRRNWRRRMLDALDAMHGTGRTRNVTIVKMPGVEHHFPDAYIPQLRSWAAGRDE